MTGRATVADGLRKCHGKVAALDALAPGPLVGRTPGLRGCGAGGPAELAAALSPHVLPGLAGNGPHPGVAAKKQRCDFTPACGELGDLRVTRISAHLLPARAWAISLAIPAAPPATCLHRSPRAAGRAGRADRE
jgi:hypothetical protein